MRGRKKILLFTDWYYPGYKAGGPIQSCRNLVQLMKGDFDFYVFTSDRDLGETNPYPGIKRNKWVNGEGKELVYYAEEKKMNLAYLRNMISRIKPDAIYFNSMFSYRFTVLPRLAVKTMRFRGKIILAPRGMLHSGAMELKSGKKKAFLQTFKLLKLEKRICFHATDNVEITDINRFFPTHPVIMAENIPHTANSSETPLVKEPGFLKMVYFSRLHPKKNLLFLLNLLRDNVFAGLLELDVFGGADESLYEKNCLSVAAGMPPNIKVRFHGAVPNNKVFELFSRYHVFVLPTLGENFGHAIFEALTSGLPVLISDNTPWRNLEKDYAGWDISLRDGNAYVSVLQRLTAMDKEEWSKWSKGAAATANRYLMAADFKEKYTALFS